MSNLVTSLFERENGIRSHKNVSQLFKQNFFGSRYIMERMEYSAFTSNPTCCMTFNYDGEFICSTSGKKLYFYDWEFDEDHNTFEAPEFKYFCEMKFRNSSKNDINIVSIVEDSLGPGNKIAQTNINPSGDIKIHSIFRDSHAISPNRLCFTLVPENPNEIIASMRNLLFVIDTREKTYDFDSKSFEWNPNQSENENIVHHPFNPEFSVYKRNGEIHVFDKRNSKDVIRTIHLVKQNRSRFPRTFSYNYDGSEFLARRTQAEVCIVKNNDRREVIRCFDEPFIEGTESCFFGPKSTYIVSSHCTDFDRSPRIIIQDKKTGKIVRDVAAKKGEYSTRSVGEHPLKRPSLSPHPKYPVLAVIGGGSTISLWTVPDINFSGYYYDESDSEQE